MIGRYRTKSVPTIPAPPFADETYTMRNDGGPPVFCYANLRGHAMNGNSLGSIVTTQAGCHAITINMDRADTERLIAELQRCLLTQKQIINGE